MKECNACGKCCIKYGGGGLSISHSELDKWEEEAPELLDYIHNGEIWTDPKDTNHKIFETCPWLKKDMQANRYTCSIYFNRPDDCRYYPSTFEEMVRDDCEMIETKDLKNPKKAQQDLELIMKDSWIS